MQLEQDAVTQRCGVRVVGGVTTAYHPDSRIVSVAPYASEYAIAHELAHARQHAEQSLCWRAYRACRWIPLLSWATVLWLELDALLRVRAACWEPHHDEAWRSLWTYVLRR